MVSRSSARRGPAIVVRSEAGRRRLLVRRLEIRASTALATWLARSRPSWFCALRNPSSERRIAIRNSSCSSEAPCQDHKYRVPTACVRRRGGAGAYAVWVGGGGVLGSPQRVRRATSHTEPL